MYQFQKYSSRACQITHILKFFGLRQKFDASGFFFQNSKFHVRKKLLLVSSMGYLSIKILMKKNSKIPKFSRQKWVECETKKNQNIICPSFLESRIGTTIQKILKCMTYPKFGATFFDLGLQLPRQILTKSKKFQNPKFFGGNSSLINDYNFSIKIFEF